MNAAPLPLARPTFIGIGVQKCGTTWIHDILRDHPEVGLGSAKELDFFSHHYDRGFQWYERQLGAGAGQRAIGEISPSYFHDAAAPARIAAYAPDARLILSLRDPVERAMSNHLHEVRVGHFGGPDLSLEAGLANNPGYVEQGRYATHLRRWLDHFPREQLLILFVEEMGQHPERVAQTIYRFLGVEEHHRPAALEDHSNAGHLMRWPRLDAVRRRTRHALIGLGLGWVWDGAVRCGLRPLYRRWGWMAPDVRVPPMTAATRRRLRALFREEMEALESLTGRLLPPWSADSARTQGEVVPLRPVSCSNDETILRCER